MLTGGSDSIPGDGFISLGDDDTDLLDEDVCFRRVYGVPFIGFFNQVKELAVKSMDFTLVLKILGRRVVVDAPAPEFYPIKGYFSVLPDDALSSLSSLPIDEEIKEASIFMVLLKALGIESLHTHFYQ
ncbi:hypothetical protein V6N12_007755 [Hibiscus sabdariffa]|uniref:Uncharacterized protein n=1 Tax=Hibiscus sabdariffa TaxID=183260 RepID=A0ABR2F2S1_9ROSI